jgi:hypothetical protein
VKLLNVKVLKKLEAFECTIPARRVHHFEFMEHIEELPDPTVALARTQWQAPPTKVSLKEVEKYLREVPNNLYQTGSAVLASSTSSNTPRAGPKYKRIKLAEEPSATEFLLAKCAREAITGEVNSFALLKSEALPTFNGFSSLDRKQLLEGKRNWAAKTSKRNNAFPRKLKSDLVELVWMLCGAY